MDSMDWLRGAVQTIMAGPVKIPEIRMDAAATVKDAVAEFRVRSDEAGTGVKIVLDIASNRQVVASAATGPRQRGRHGRGRLH